MKKNACVCFLLLLLITASSGVSSADSSKKSDQTQVRKNEADPVWNLRRRDGAHPQRKAPQVYQKQAITGPNENAAGSPAEKRIRQQDKTELQEAVRNCRAIRDPALRRTCFSNAAGSSRGAMKLADCSKINNTLARKKCQASNKLAVKQSMSANDLDPAARKKLEERLRNQENIRERRTCLQSARRDCIERFPGGSQIGERRKCEDAEKAKCGP